MPTREGRVTTCELAESKLQPILEQEAAIGVTTQDVASERSALQDAYNKLQTEYYQIAQQPIPMGDIQGQQANIAAEMQILASDISMFAGQ